MWFFKIGKQTKSVVSADTPGSLGVFRQNKIGLLNPFQSVITRTGTSGKASSVSELQKCTIKILANLPGKGIATQLSFQVSHSCPVRYVLQKESNQLLSHLLSKVRAYSRRVQEQSTHTHAHARTQHREVHFHLNTVGMSLNSCQRCVFRWISTLSHRRLHKKAPSFRGNMLSS